MMTYGFTLFLAASALCYGLAFVFHWCSFAGIREEGHSRGHAMIRLGLLLGTIAIIYHAFESHWLLLVGSLADALSFFAWSLAFVYLVLLRRIRSESFGLVLNPILFILVAAAAITSFGAEPINAKTVVKNHYFVIHVITAFFAYASFSISLSASILFLVQHRQLKKKQGGQFYYKLPSLEALEKLIYQPIMWGVPLLVSAVVVGFVWSQKVFGEIWLSDPKTVMTTAIAGFYFVILCLRQTAYLRGKKIAVWSILAFLLMILGFIGLRFCEGSQHYFQ